MRRKALVAAVATALAAGVALVGGPTGATGSNPSDRAEQRLGVYLVHDVRGAAVERLAGTGVSVEEPAGDGVTVSGTDRQADRLRERGYRVTTLSEPGRVEEVSRAAAAEEYPPGFEAYHTYDEMVAALDKIVADHPDIAQKFSLGKSHEGRDIWGLKISDQVATDEAEPEALFTCRLHAREIITTEQCLAWADLLVGGYGSDDRITGLVDGREVVIIPEVNPDGAEFDIASGDFAMWRKNRQPNAGSSYVGTDLNRNFGYKWGCCDGSSTDPSAEDYRGEAAFSAPEARVIQDYTESRVKDGKQQITTHIDAHSYGDLVLYPYGYTDEDVPSDMTQDEHETVVALGQAFAKENGYTAEQSSELYITDGAIDDNSFGHLYGDGDRHWGVAAFTFEIGDDFYPPASEIEALTGKNSEPFLIALDYADCPSRIIGKPCS
ncbi:M14 family metallopeptidase [Nocardioides speluncae]|uniref:M14 family metallopeptidase n=1 Tax=Nocardioides speluncae TaxID=2670337 RepID=UPI000D68C1FE|nr:M14 family metallopeptidase [Nocardioides speluncae]